MAVDAADSVIELRELHQRTHNILGRFSRAVAATDSNLVKAVREWIQRTSLKKLRVQVEGRVQVLSCTPCRLSVDARALLTNLQISPGDSVICSASESSSASRTTVCPCNLRAGTRVQPITPLAGKAQRSQSWFHSRMHENFNTLSEPLELLFTSECMILTEYLETIIPIMYGFGILVHLPSAQYHSEMHGITLHNVGSKVLGIFAYGLLELASFAALATVIRCNCGIRALYQLAFVLETQMPLVQAKFMLWVMMMPSGTIYSMCVIETRSRFFTASLISERTRITGSSNSELLTS